MPTEMLKLENLEYLSLRQNTLKEFLKNINSISFKAFIFENSIYFDSVEL
jgi:hypothetical protein